MKFAYVLEKYSGLKSRHTCPECGSKYQFARYIDAEGNYLADRVGRCNRESKCGYHMKPKEYFEETPLRSIQSAKRAKPELVKEIQYVSPDVLKSTLRAYEQNSFVIFLRTLFNAHTVRRLIDTYRLGTTRDGSCIFWQVDNRGRIRTGKVIRYGDDGHRDKSQLPYFMHIKLNIEHIEQCLFGLHLLMVDERRPIGLVESEKTAVRMAGELPDYTWMATGGKSNLRTVHVLKGQTVVVFPDTDAFDEWTKKLRPYGFKISSALQKYVNDPENGYDLADDFETRSQKKYFETLKDGRVMEMHPAGYPMAWLQSE